MFTRAGMFITTLSAAVVAIALVAQATDFGENFRIFALLVLPIVLLVGIGTFIRLGDAREEDVTLVIGMNRLRHAYLELAPELEPYFVTSRFDDMPGVMKTYGDQGAIRPSRILASTPALVGIIDAMLVGVLAALITDAVGGISSFTIAVGIIAAIGSGAVIASSAFRQIARVHREYQPRFPGPD
ncbi:MAG: hypothetical protein ACR2OU_20670 [Thermomicrobiales bacterium]